jgi:hypothetical protein
MAVGPRPRFSEAGSQLRCSPSCGRCRRTSQLLPYICAGIVSWPTGGSGFRGCPPRTRSSSRYAPNRRWRCRLSYRDPDVPFNPGLRRGAHKVATDDSDASALSMNLSRDAARASRLRGAVRGSS